MNKRNHFESVLFWFEEISKFPRGSYNVSKISNFLVEFAKIRGLEYSQDEYFNVIIKKEASTKDKTVPPIMIQGHMDMVAVKTKECTKDLAVEGLDLEIKDGYLSAKGTSLGADDGIAIAYMLALLDSDEIPHPPLEMVMTTEEEVGMEGATNIEVASLKGKTILNIDSEEEGIFLAGCAGGARLRWSKQYESVIKQGVSCKLSVQGLQGGHSGMEIHKPRANAILLLAMGLQKVENEMDLALVSFWGGVADNAIPTSATTQFMIESDRYHKAESIVNQWMEHAKKIVDREPAMEFTFEIEENVESRCLLPEKSKQLLDTIEQLPNGVQSMSKDVEGLVETSLNLGKLNLVHGEVEGTFAIRSSIDLEKEALIVRIQEILEKQGMKQEVSGNYPGWEYQKKSPIRDKMIDLYEKMYQEKPQVEAIHAGLELGLFVEKMGEVDCISFGPNILDIHTTAERLEIASAKRVWEFLLELLKSVT